MKKMTKKGVKSTFEGEISHILRVNSHRYYQKQ